MKIKCVLIANRGEIANRIIRAAAELDMRTIAVYAEDDAQAQHRYKADQAIELKGRGVAAYLDAEQIIEIAKNYQCDAIHPGYGFLSENAQFAELCEKNALIFVGPTSEQLRLFGDKVQARELARVCDVPLLPGTPAATTLEQAREFMVGLGKGGAAMIKAISGGGGRGMRPVYDLDELDAAYQRCQSEAKAAFGNGDLYIEQLLARARHIEIQVIGDGTGDVTHLYERECTLQRRNQKVMEIAPSPVLSLELRQKMTQAALTLAAQADYKSLGTFEFLVEDRASHKNLVGGEKAVFLRGNTPFYFMEANPRVQVEHTVTEEVLGIDLVKSQLKIAQGDTLTDLSLKQSDIPSPRGYAVQLRINMETLDIHGNVKPSGGTLTAFEMPLGIGIRHESYGYTGYASSPSYDSLLAKLVVHSPSAEFKDVTDRTYRALCEYKIEGVSTNLQFLKNLLTQDPVLNNEVYTRYIEDNLASLANSNESSHQQLFVAASDIPIMGTLSKNKPSKPLGEGALVAPMQGHIISIDVAVGEKVKNGQQLIVMEAMKMEHVIKATCNGYVSNIPVKLGESVSDQHHLVSVQIDENSHSAAVIDEYADFDHIRSDLAESERRHRLILDESRPQAVERRRKTGHRTTRENIEDLCDDDSFIEYGSLVIAAQRRRREESDLLENTPADGLVAGIGDINGDLFTSNESRCAILSYDYTVLAGTQGHFGHEKKDRLFELAHKWKLPLVFFTEGGGGRPGDTDALGVAGLNCMSFYLFGRLSGTVPLVGINTGHCFAGNAAILGCCDVVIATEGSNLGMGGPAMIEGGGLGKYTPEDVGPLDVQLANGVVDIAVKDEAEAVSVAKQYISYFQGDRHEWTCADQRLLRHIIPENRLRIYDVRDVIFTLCDADSTLELRRHFGLGMITSLARVEGKPIGIIANNPSYMGGAITSDGADKAARFMQLCNNFSIPILFLCDTPGIMVGPEAEKSGTVRHAARMCVTGANLSTPFFTIILRKGYGLGALAMAGGSSRVPFFTVSWPSAEFGGMGLEGAVRLGHRKELEAIDDPVERKAKFDEMVEQLYQHGKAVNMASYFEIDDVIDPADSRRIISAALISTQSGKESHKSKHNFIDTW